MNEKIGKFIGDEIIGKDFICRSFQHARDEALSDRDRHVQLEKRFTTKIR